MPSGRAARVGKVVAVPGGDGEALAERLSSRGYALQETAHFRVLRRPGTGGQTILLHPFDEATIDEDVSPMVAEELGPLGIVAGAEAYGATLFAIVASTCPASLDCPTCGRLHLDNPAIWRHYGVNTVRRLETWLAGPPRPAAARASQIELFAAIYRRVLEWRVGGTLLDVGTNLGALPALLARRAPELTVVACDVRPESVAVGADLAVAVGADRARFVQADLLAPDFAELGRFDTVTAVHLLEHLPEEAMPAALTGALAVTTCRLIVAVPYEETAEPLYGHAQTFTPSKLREWGAWCVNRLGTGRFWCEDEAGGGLLVVDRSG